MSNFSERLLAARILVLAPHMDDEMLGCGGTMLLHTAKPGIHCFFATDGAASPVPLLPWTGERDASLAGLRRRESLAVADSIGIPLSNMRFADLPDGRLIARPAELLSAVRDVVRATRPEFVLAPFRFDVHPDHTALNQAARTALCEMQAAPALLEYFVYHRMRFVPGGDVRQAIDESSLFTVDTTQVADAKRDALNCYRSQTTLCYPWQERPILTAESLRERCAEAEFFMPTDPHSSLSAGLGRHAHRIRLACLVMRYGKPPKDRARALFNWILQR